MSDELIEYTEKSLVEELVRRNYSDADTEIGDWDCVVRVSDEKDDLAVYAVEIDKTTVHAVYPKLDTVGDNV